MAGRRRLSLRVRIVLALSVLVTVMVVVAELRSLHASGTERARSLRLRTELLAEAQATALALPLAAQDLRAVRAGLAGLMRDPEFVAVTVFDASDEPFAGLHHENRADLVQSSEPIEVSRPIEFTGPSGEVRLIGRVQIAMSTHLLAEKYRSDVWSTVVELILMLAVLIVGLLAAIRSFTRPIEAMTSVMRRRARGDYSGSVDPAYLKRDDEIGAIARSLEYDQQQRRDEERMLEITTALSSQLQLDILLEKIMAGATELLDAERSTLFLWDPREKVLWSRVAEGLESFRITLQSGQGIAGSVFASGEVVNIDDPYNDDRFNPEVDRRTGFRTRSLLCMPIINKNGDRIGVVQVLNRRGGPFQERHVERLRSMSAQAAIAIENAQLFEAVLNMRNYNEGILKSLSNGVITLDETLRIGKANDAAGRILLEAADALEGRLAEEVFHGANAWIAEAAARVARTGQSDVTLDADLHLGGGETASLNLTVVPLKNIGDEVIGVMLVLEDLSSEKRVRATMARYMSKSVVDQLLGGHQDVLGGTSQMVTTLFCDIRGFTSTSENVGARETVQMLNEYFTEMVDVIDGHHGILDKYIGDAIMALFGAPFVNERDADNAVRTANEMIRALARLNERRGARGQEQIRIGIGINSGEVVAGNIGSPKRMDYTVIGDPVNLAARLESATKVYGARILLSEFTLALISDREMIREVDLIRVKGKVQPVGVYESLGYLNGHAGEHVRQAIDLQAAALKAFRQQNFKLSGDLFQKAAELWREDPLPALYRERARQYLEVPPGDDWDGVFVMPGK